MVAGRPLNIDYATTPMLLPKPGAAAGAADATPGGFKDEWWSPVLRAELILSEFAAEKLASIKPGGDKAPTLAISTDPERLKAEIRDLMELWHEREEREAEILAQASDFSGAFINLLQAGGGRRPATETLIHAAIAIGGMAVMEWKLHFNRARPDQVYPPLLPLIPTPPHPAFPSGHATQAFLTAHLLFRALGTEKGAPGMALEPVLLALAGRIARNREIAGVHFQSDSAAGRDLAVRIAEELFDAPCCRFGKVLEAVKEEWQGVGVGAPPDAIERWVEPGKRLAEELARAIARPTPPLAPPDSPPSGRPKKAPNKPRARQQGNK